MPEKMIEGSGNKEGGDYLDGEWMGFVRKHCEWQFVLLELGKKLRNAGKEFGAVKPGAVVVCHEGLVDGVGFRVGTMRRHTSTTEHPGAVSDEGPNGVDIVLTMAPCGEGSIEGCGNAGERVDESSVEIKDGGLNHGDGVGGQVRLGHAILSVRQSGW